MSTTLQRYTNYRDAGVEWLGEIPAHWHITSIGRVSQLVQTGPFGSQLHSSDYVENGVPVINPSHLRDGRITPDASVAVSNATADRLARHQFRTGDVIAARRGELGRCAVVTAVESGWLCSTGSLIIRPRCDLLFPAYLQLVLSSRGVSDALGFASVGSTLNNLSAGLVARQRMPILPVSEQKAIARFLIHAQRQVNQLIRNKRRLIALLNEEKQAIIQQAVTRGLDPDAPMKPSGMEWLGEIPAHWNVAEAKTQFEITLGKMHQGALVDSTDTLVPYIKSQHVQWFAVRTDNLPHMWASPNDLANVEVCDGDLLVCEGGEAGRCGIAAKVPSSCIIEKSIHRVRGRKEASVEFLQYVLYTVAVTGWFSAINNKSTIAHFTREKFGWLLIPVPPSDEQHAIAQHLDRQTSEINVIIDRINREIDLIREYRTRLIADVVTGQLDVREAASSLPDVEDEEVAPASGDGDAFEEGGEFSDEELDSIENADAAD